MALLAAELWQGISSLMPQDVQLPLGKVTLELQRGHLLNTEIAKPWYTKITSASATSATLNDAFLLKNCTANIGKMTAGPSTGHLLWVAWSFWSFSISTSLGCL